MAGHSRPKDGVASLAYDPAIHVLLQKKKDVDGRHKAGHDGAILLLLIINFFRNTCVRNVSGLIQSCDACRVLVHLPHDRAPFALHATENIFRMSAAHERHLASALACANESR